MVSEAILEATVEVQKTKEALEELSFEVFHIVVDDEEGYKIDELPDILGALLTNRDVLKQANVRIYRYNTETQENIEPLKLFPYELAYLRNHPTEFTDLKMTLALSKSYSLKDLGLTKVELEEFVDNY